MADDRRAGEKLPIYEMEGELCDALSGGGRVIVEAPTGSGKSTQIPQMILRHGLSRGQILILQPRRIAARMLAARVAREMGTDLGGDVGYQVRFEDRSSGRTRIKYITEAILLRKILNDPQLRNVDTVIFDEFHERHLYGDVSIGMAMKLQQTVRPDLKIIVMSATLESDRLAKYLNPCRIVKGEGRMYEVTIEYLPKAPDANKTPVWELASRELDRILPQYPEGDILVFMPGAYEINRTMQELGNLPRTRSCQIMALHGELPIEQQEAAIGASDRRKIVVATNVAETSLTISGIRIVVDSGLARIARFDSNRGINTLWIEKISRASADQRKGRAGRTMNGHCLRLWTEIDQTGRPAHETPEIHRVDLTEVALTLKAAGVRDLDTFPWVEAPVAESIRKAEALLRDLEAIEPVNGEITELGRRLIAFPLHPRYARMLLAGDEHNCVRTVALIAAMTQERGLLVRAEGERTRELRERKIEDSSESDFVKLINAWDYADRADFKLDACREVGIHAVTARQVGRLYDQFVRIAQAEGLRVGQDVIPGERGFDRVARCILAGFPDHVACRLSGGTFRCEMVHKRRGDLAKESAVRDAPLLVACEVREIEGRKKEMNVVLNLATAVKQEWLAEMFPHAFTEGRVAQYDAVQNRVVVERQTRFMELVIAKKQGEQPTEAEATAILAEEVLAGRIRIPSWDESVEQWFTRINALAEWCPETGIRKLTDEDKKLILHEVCAGCFGAKDLKQREVWPALRAFLKPDQQAKLDKHAPERVTLANGRSAKVKYDPNAAPTISLPIQSLYGVDETPRIAMGRAPLLLSILAPNQRPVQVTQDLGSFWRERYPAVKKELCRRYPKHEWR